MQHRNSAERNPCRQIEVAFTYSFPFLPASSSISSTSYLKSRVKINAETPKRKNDVILPRRKCSLSQFFRSELTFRGGKRERGLNAR